MAQINIRIDDDLKDQAELFLNELGFNFSSVFNVFIRQALREKRIPFDIDMRNVSISADYELPESEIALRAAEVGKGVTVARRGLKVEEIITRPAHGIDWYLQDYERPDGGWEDSEPRGREAW